MLVFGCLLCEWSCRGEAHQSPFGLDEGPVLAIHLVVKSAGVAQVVARPVPPPQRGGGGTAVHALTALCIEFKRRAQGEILYN